MSVVEERRTVFVSKCSGASQPGCGQVFGRRLEEWSGAAEVVTHGVCPECFEREADAFYTAAVIDEVLEIEGDCSPPWDREPRKFGTGPGEIHGSAAISVLARADARREPLFGLLELGAFAVLLGLVLLAIAAAPTGGA